MLYVVASPDLMTAAATNLAEIGSAISTANGAAALPTVEVVAAAADEVSTQIAALFGAHARSYQPSAPRQRRFIVGLCRR
ncbi:PE PGRS family protein [Mycobacterium tuberculosis]|nr:PE PGRS family protein [Mycobacterium tuberculosis]